MARIEYVVLRLNNWALWAERNRARGLGYASQSILLASEVRGDPRESRLPVDEIEAGITDQAVSALKLSHPDLHRVVVMTYLNDIGQAAIARTLGISRAAVCARLERADAALRAWFNARAERRAAEKKSFTP